MNTHVGLALCKCGIDMVDHPDVDADWNEDPYELAVAAGLNHTFDPSGARYRCENNTEQNGHLVICLRPMYHEEEGVPCGHLTGNKLWD